jgi:regulator of RNase E activity RraA
MQALDFPVYAKGVVQTSVRGRTGFVGYQMPVRCGGVDVDPGDLVIADANGVVVVRAAVTEEVLKRARSICDMEAKVKSAVDAGESPVAVHRRLRYDHLFGVGSAEGTSE